MTIFTQEASPRRKLCGCCLRYRSAEQNSGSNAPLHDGIHVYRMLCSFFSLAGIYRISSIFVDYRQVFTGCPAIFVHRHVEPRKMRK